jgi:hypothetical protein
MNQISKFGYARQNPRFLRLSWVDSTSFVAVGARSRTKRLVVLAMDGSQPVVSLTLDLTEAKEPFIMTLPLVVSIVRALFRGSRDKGEEVR